MKLTEVWIKLSEWNEKYVVLLLNHAWINLLGISDYKLLLWLVVRYRYMSVLYLQQKSVWYNILQKCAFK